MNRSGKNLSMAVALAGLVTSAPLLAAECPASIPGSFDLADTFKDRGPESAWVGSPELAALVPANAYWKGMGKDYNYRNKWWWWREGYSAHEEPLPALVITAIRLDGSTDPFRVDDATNALSLGPNDDDLMLVGMEFPEAGCWEVIGSYGVEELRFVFEVGD